MMAMMVLPIDPSHTLVVLGGPMPQFKDRQAGVRATDRDSGIPLVSVQLALPVEGGSAQVLRVTLPEPGVPAGLVVGGTVRATGLVFLSGEKGGRVWQMFRAAAISEVKK
jgi:hypothetical protein